jgi:hypothetical protein
MVLRHMGWLRFKDGVSPERIEEHMAACRTLVGRIPMLENLECGPILTKDSGGFTHCTIAYLPDRDALSAYLAHPDRWAWEQRSRASSSQQSSTPTRAAIAAHI